MRQQITRHAYVCEHVPAVATRVDGPGAVAFVWTDGQQHVAVVFTGRRARPDSVARYGNDADRDAAVRVRLRGAAAAAVTPPRRAIAALDVGAVLVSRWGDGHVDYYQVVGRQADDVMLRPIEGCDGEPVTGAFIGPAFRKRAGVTGVRIDATRVAVPELV